MADLASADEVFLTSTTRDVQPVARIDDRELPAPGPFTATAPRPSPPSQPRTRTPDA